MEENAASVQLLSGNGVARTEVGIAEYNVGCAYKNAAQ
jgi:hypothetical protein